MSHTNYLVCPKCRNTYPLTKNFIQCPSCEINLTTPTESLNTNIRRARDIRDNSGSVILGDGNIVNEQAKSKVANYDFCPKGTINNLQLGLPAIKWLTVWLASMWLLNTSGSIASILSIFGIQLKPEQLKQFILSLNSAIFDMRWPLSILVTLVSLYFIYTWINKIRELYNGEYVHVSGDKFYKKYDGTLRKGSLGTQCPSESCSGYLTVAEAPSNDQGIKIIGICNKKSKLHRYDFDIKTLQGEWVTLTKKEKPSSNQAR
jgi:hypothetical protein